MNLVQGMLEELARARELLRLYEGIPTGVFGAAVIRAAIKDAEQSMAVQDLPDMIRAFEALEKLE